MNNINKSSCMKQNKFDIIIFTVSPQGGEQFQKSDYSKVKKDKVI